MSDLHSRISTSVRATIDKRHTLFVHDAGCTLNIFKGNAMVQATFELEDLQKLAALLMYGLDEWKRAKQVEAEVNVPAALPPI